MNTPKTAPDFGEPWDFDGENWIADSHNAEILNLDSIHSKNAKRLIACVNACAGMADPAAEMQAMRDAAASACEFLQGIEDHLDDNRGMFVQAAIAELRSIL